MMNNDSANSKNGSQANKMPDQKLQGVAGGTGTGAWYARCTAEGCGWVSQPYESDQIAHYQYNELHYFATGHMAACIYYE